jgi:hypothetical protein
MWEKIRQIVSANPELFSILGLAVGVAGLLVALIIYKTSKPRRLLAYATRTFRIISDKSRRVSGLKVLYNDRTVQSLSVTRLGLWNAGNETIRRDDIPSMLPPVIYSRKGVTILETQVLETTSLANKVELKACEDASGGYAVQFDFLDPSDGALFGITHDGVDVKDVAMTGGIIGGRIRCTRADPETITVSADDAHAATTIVKVQSGRSQARSAAVLVPVICSIMGIGLAIFVNLLMGLLLSLIGATCAGALLSSLPAFLSTGSAKDV